MVVVRVDKFLLSINVIATSFSNTLPGRPRHPRPCCELEQNMAKSSPPPQLNPRRLELEQPEGRFFKENAR